MHSKGACIRKIGTTTVGVGARELARVLPVVVIGERLAREEDLVFQRTLVVRASASLLGLAGRPTS